MSPFLVLPRVLSKPLRWPIESARQAAHRPDACDPVTDSTGLPL
jgi:hypothetical protein